jgi:hypothetical protein
MSEQLNEQSHGDKLDSAQEAASAPAYNEQEFGELVAKDARLAATIRGFEEQFNRVHDLCMTHEKLMMGLVYMVNKYSKGKKFLVVDKPGLACVTGDDRLFIHADPAGRGVRISIVDARATKPLVNPPQSETIGAPETESPETATSGA